jgi:hypothetical protein
MAAILQRQCRERKDMFMMIEEKEEEENKMEKRTNAIIAFFHANLHEPLEMVACFSSS